jgi:hypothetical protein
LVALSMVGLLAMLALVVDGGNAWVQQRIAQNGTDATAVAGSTVLAQKLGASTASLVCSSTDDPCWDGVVASKITEFAATNGIAVDLAYYTDLCGQALKADGTLAADTSLAARVGGGVLPAPGALPPDPATCSSNPPVGPVAGVRVFAAKPFGTLVGRVIGITGFTASTQATAVVGFLQSACDTSTGSNCSTLPVALPPYLTYCDGTGRSVPTTTDYPLNTRVVIPICKNGPGNFGWIDWEPDDGHNGTSGLVYCLENPCTSDESLAAWLPIAMSGNPSSSQLENALNAHIGEVLAVPIFDGMCSANPDLAQSTGPAPFGCPDAPPYDPEAGMNGSTNWYHVYQLSGFQLERAYTNGNNEAECNPSWSPSGGSNDCIIGTFTTLVGGGEVGGNPGPVTQDGFRAVGVQLIR